MLEIRIKRILDSIIDEAYQNEDPVQMKRLKGYYIALVPRELKTCSGRYYADAHRIEVYNLSLGEKSIAKVCIHELAHHIDLVLNGTTGHQAPFYEAYARLIYASLDLGILTKYDFLNDSREKAKVQKIVLRYVPKGSKIKSEKKKLIKVFNAFTVKDFLKSAGYQWNPVEQTWEKDLVSDMDVLALEEHGVYSERKKKEPFYDVKYHSLYVDAVIAIVASGDTYGCRDVLKTHGFRYDGQTKNWIKKVPASNLPENIRRLRAEKKFRGLRISAGQQRIL